MSNFEDTFKGLLLEFIKRWNVDAVEVTAYEEDYRIESYGGCSTCAFDEHIYEVDIFYVDRDGFRSCYTYTGKFSELLGELIQISKELEAR